MSNNKQEKKLEFQVFKNATILPYEFKNGTKYSGIFDSKGSIIEYSLLFRKNEQVIFPNENIGSQNILNDTCIFGGYLVGHYGHFLLESLSRLWYIKKYPELPIIWIHRSGKNFQSLKQWQKEIFSLLNIQNKQIMITVPTVVKKITIPEPGCVLRDYFSRDQAYSLVIMKCKEIKKGKKVWLSRSHLNPQDSVSAIYNDRQLEQLLETLDWIIFHPQKHSVTEQIIMLASAEQIAGFHGSAFHSLVFLDDIKAKITIFGRHNLGNGLPVNETYRMIAETKKLKQTEHYVTQTKIREKTKNYGASVYLIHSYKEIVEILNDTGE